MDEDEEDEGADPREVDQVAPGGPSRLVLADELEREEDPGHHEVAQLKQRREHDSHRGEEEEEPHEEAKLPAPCEYALALYVLVEKG